MSDKLTRKAQQVYKRLINGQEVNFKGLSLEEGMAVLDKAESEWQGMMLKLEELEKKIAAKKKQARAVLAEIQAGRKKITKAVRGE